MMHSKHNFFTEVKTKSFSSVPVVGCVAGLIFLLPVDAAGIRKVAREPEAVYPEGDRDRDGIKDTLEQELAEKYAPIVFYRRNETEFPTNVAA